MTKNLVVENFGEAGGIVYKKIHPINKKFINYILQVGDNTILSVIAVRVENDSLIAFFNLYTNDGKILAENVSESYIDSKILDNMRNRIAKINKGE